MIYEADSHQLPESYNGLGYLNLISIIIQIETILAEFRCDNNDNIAPSDINLLFIEEPEAHTHPQMQYVFIKNIKDVLIDGSIGEDLQHKINLQTVITTHSSHIVAECVIYFFHHCRQKYSFCISFIQNSLICKKNFCIIECQILF